MENDQDDDDANEEILDSDELDKPEALSENEGKDNVQNEMHTFTS